MSDIRISFAKKNSFQRDVLGYYRAHGRDFPWRHNCTPYRILISEFMLQQTQVSRVAEKYGPFLKKFPDFESLAASSLRGVLAAWQGLGYNRRAVNLHKLAQVVVKEYGSKLPRDFETLKALPGVGQSTAGAVMAFAFNMPAIFIETNIRRVFIHFFFPRKKKIHDDEIIGVLEKVNNFSWQEWYWALFDYGAMLGEKGRSENPNRRSAHYKKQSKFEGSRRQLRGEILRLLLVAPKTKVALLQVIERKPKEILDVLRELKSEKIILEKNGVCSVTQTT